MSFKLHIPFFSSMLKSYAFLRYLAWDMNLFWTKGYYLYLEYLCCIHYPPISHLEVVLVIRSTAVISQSSSKLCCT